MAEKKPRKKYASVLYPWQKKPKTQREDLQKRLIQLKRARNTLIILIIIFLVTTILTAKWFGVILVVVLLIILTALKTEKNQIESMLGRKKKK